MKYNEMKLKIYLIDGKVNYTSKEKVITCSC